MKNSKKNCVICSKKIDKEFSPFCSKRCSLVDLNKWLREEYSINSYNLDIINKKKNNIL